MPILNKTILFDTTQIIDGLEKSIFNNPVDIIIELKDSGLRGRGGAGFPTGTKWNLAMAAKSEKKFIVCNADEGEPGTFKDRVLLLEYPKLIFEGMVIAGYAINAQKGFLYLRDEYRYILSHLEDFLKNMRDENRLGANILGSNFSFDIEIRMGSGAYVCGEESALIESLEGHRGEPRNRPPFPVNTGYLGFPTVVNNVETFASVSIIMSKGAVWFKNFGTHISSGMKLVSISGDCNKPGVYEIPYGTTIKEILKLVDSDKTKAVQVGGASGFCVPKSEFDRTISFEDLSTGGSIMIFNESRDMLKILKNFTEFFVEESCGQCVPCRIGNTKLLDGIIKIENGTCSNSYLNELIELGNSMQVASKCGLGQSSANPFISIMKHFENEIFSVR